MATLKGKELAFPESKFFPFKSCPSCEKGNKYLQVSVE